MEFQNLYSFGSSIVGERKAERFSCCMLQLKLLLVLSNNMHGLLGKAHRQWMKENRQREKSENCRMKFMNSCHEFFINKIEELNSYREREEWEFKQGICMVEWIFYFSYSFERDNWQAGAGKVSFSLQLLWVDFTNRLLYFVKRVNKVLKEKKQWNERNGGNFLTKCEYFTFSFLINFCSTIAGKKIAKKIIRALPSRLAIKWSLWKMSRLNMKDIMTRWQVDDLSSNSSHSFAALINKTFIFAIKFLFFDSSLFIRF